MAVKLQQGGKLTANEKSNLRAAVGRHPFYVKNASADAGFNGV
jgi:hypothetical protein